MMSLKTELKQLIFRLREEGNSYKAISDILRAEYCIDRTPQAIQKSYAKTLREKEEYLDMGKQNSICDIMNVYALGYNMSETHSIIANKLGIHVSYTTVTNTIKNNAEYLKSISKAMLATISDNIDSNESSEALRNRLEYKGIAVTDKRFLDIIHRIYQVKIENSVNKLVAEAYRKCKNPDIVRQFSKEYSYVTSKCVQEQLSNIEK